MKRPSFQWYPGDFRRDVALQACSFDARSLWREMLDLMHDGEPYGHLTAGGVPIDLSGLARMVGLSLGRARSAMAELASRKVYSTTEEGVIFSRRMLRDEHIRNVRADAGKLGGSRDLGVDYNEPGYVYAMLRSSDGAIKIGISKSPEKRRYRVERQFPDSTVSLLAKCFVSDMGTTEARLHERFADSGKSGEWFHLNDHERAELLHVHLKVKNEVNDQRSPPPAVAVAVASASAFAETSASSDETALLDALPADRRRAWEAEIEAQRSGMHGKPLVQSKIDEVCRDFLGNGGLDNPSMRHFRAYFDNAREGTVVRKGRKYQSKQELGRTHLADALARRERENNHGE